MRKTNVALAPFLAECPAVTTLGIRACLGDYSEEDRLLLRQARVIFFPTIRFLEIFQAIGKPTFPSRASYRYPRARVLQEVLFQYMKLPRPRRRIYFGPGQKQHILKDFSFPFLLMGPRVPADPVCMIHGRRELEDCQRRFNPVLVQEYVKWRERVRLIFVHFNLVGALRRVGNEPDRASFEPLPCSHPMLSAPVEITQSLLHRIHLDDTMLEWGLGQHGWQLIALARPPVRWAATTGTMHHYAHIRALIESGRL